MLTCPVLIGMPGREVSLPGFGKTSHWPSVSKWATGWHDWVSRSWEQRKSFE